MDEQTNETYTLTFGDENTLFQSRMGGRHQNFTWTTSDNSLFELQANQDYTAQYNAQAIEDATTYQSKSFESNQVTDPDFNSWVNSNTLTNWTSSAATVISRKDITGFATMPSGSNDYVVQFDTQDGFISQSFTVKGNSTYQIRTIASSSNAGAGTIDMYISGAYHKQTWRGITGTSWHQTRDDFYTSGSSGVDQNLMIKFTAVSASLHFSFSFSIILKFLNRVFHALFHLFVNHQYHNHPQEVNNQT